MPSKISKMKKASYKSAKRTTIISCLVLGAATLTNCSDKLTESKAEKLVTECIAKYPSYATATIHTGYSNYLSNDVVRLKEKGLVKIEEKLRNMGFGNRYKYYLVTFTDKARPYIVTEGEPSDILWNQVDSSVKVYSAKLDNVGAIQEIPATNSAEVSITLKKTDKTPFYDVLEKDTVTVKEKKIVLKKTENKGWIYCD